LFDFTAAQLKQSNPGSATIMDGIILYDKFIPTLLAYFVNCLKIILFYRVTMNLQKMRVLPRRAEFVGANVLYVARTATLAFTDPRRLVLKLTLDLMVEWKFLTVSLLEWSKLFMLVNIPSDDDSPTSLANLEARELFASKAEAHRTPRK
jgi:hypothetical protein